MRKLSTNLIVIFIVIYSEEIASNNLIQLEYLREAFAFDVKDVGGFCGAGCGGLPYRKIGYYKSSIISQSCNGYLDKCQTIVGSTNHSLEYCFNADGSRMVWAKNKQYLGVSYGKQPKECTVPNIFKLKKWSGTNCEVCMCICYHEKGPFGGKDMWRFSLAEQISRDEKVVTGIKFTMINNTIYLQIKENELTSTDNGTWVEIIEDSESQNFEDEKFNELTFVSFTHDLQTIKLDEILIPDDRVITGVRFVRVSNPDKTYSLELNVRSTKLNAENDGLDTMDHKWHSGNQSTFQVKSRWWPNRGVRNIPMSKVSFNRTSINEDFGRFTSPKIYADAIGTCSKRDYPLKGIQLLLIKLGNEEVIIPRISPAIINDSLPIDWDLDDYDEYDSTDSANSMNFEFHLIVMSLLITSSLLI